MIRPFVDAAGVLRPTPMERFVAMREAGVPEETAEDLMVRLEVEGTLDAEQPPEGGCPRPLSTSSDPGGSTNPGY